MKLMLPLLALATVVAGCRSVEPAAGLQRMKFHEPHMGTLFTITMYAATEEQGRAAARAAFDRVEDLNFKLSDYDADSELVKLCEGPHGVPVHVSEELFTVLQHSQNLARESGGAFDVTLGPLIRLWRQSRKTHTLPIPEAIEEARKSVGWQKLQLDSQARTVTLTVPGMRLDLGGIAKGYAADEALKVLRQHGVGIALVAASGDLAIGDAPPERKGWRVGIGSMESAGTLAETLVLKNRGVSTSGDAEQYVEIGGQRFSHIINPVTGLGLTERIGVTVIAPKAMLSDGLDTAISVMGLDRGKKFAESQSHIETLIVRRMPPAVYVSPGIKRLRAQSFEWQPF